MNTTVDARGLSCPQPVLLTKNAIDDGAFPIEVLVDTATARDNVDRTARKAGLKVAIEAVGDEYRLLLEK